MNEEPYVDPDVVEKDASDKDQQDHQEKHEDGQQQQQQPNEDEQYVIKELDSFFTHLKSAVFYPNISAEVIAKWRGTLDSYVNSIEDEKKEVDLDLIEKKMNELITPTFLQLNVPGKVERDGMVIIINIIIAKKKSAKIQ